MRKIAKAIAALFALACMIWQSTTPYSAEKWVTSAQNSKQYSVPLGTDCAPAKVDQSATGRVEYHNVVVKPDAAVPFPCKKITVTDPTPPPVVTPPPVTPPPASTGVQTPESIIASKQVVYAYTDPFDKSAKTYTVTGTRVYVVTPTGCSTPPCDGSLAKPFAPTQVRTTAAPGNIYLHRAGQYTGLFGGNWGARNYVLGAAQSGIAIVGMPGEVAELIAPDDGGNFILYDGLTHAENITIAGLKLNGGSVCLMSGYGTITNGIAAKSGKNLAFVGNVCSARYTGNTMSGLIGVSGDNAKVLWNEFLNAGWSALWNNNHATYVQAGASNVLVEGNYYHNLQLGGVLQVHEDGEAQTYSNVVIRHNVFRGTNAMDMRCITVSNVSDASTVLIEENLCDNVGQLFATLSVYGGQVTARKNIFKDILAGAAGKIWLSDQYSHQPHLTLQGNTIIGGTGPDYGLNDLSMRNIACLSDAGVPYNCRVH